MAKKSKDRKEYISTGVVAHNKKAGFNYAIEDKLEAGIMLTGTEVKSLRLGHANIIDAYVIEKEGELYISNLYIAEYSHKGYESHQEKRDRKLLLHKKEVIKLLNALNQKGYTIIATKIYFNKFGKAKVELGLGKGKKLHDKRETEKQRDWNRDKARILNNFNQ